MNWRMFAMRKRTGGRIYFPEVRGGRLETGHFGPVVTRDPSKRRACEGRCPDRRPDPDRVVPS